MKIKSTMHSCFGCSRRRALKGAVLNLLDIVKLNKLVALVFLLFLIPQLIPLVASQSAFGNPIVKENYEISRELVYREISEKTIIRDTISITNLGTSQISISVSASPELDSVIEFEVSGVIIDGGGKEEFYFDIIGRETGAFEGEMILSGGISERLPVTIIVSNRSALNGFGINVVNVNKRVPFHERIDFKVEATKYKGNRENITLHYTIRNTGTNETFHLDSDLVNMTNSTQIAKSFFMPKNLSAGNYVLEVNATFPEGVAISKTEFEAYVPFLRKKILGIIPVWSLFILLILAMAGTGSFFVVRREIRKRKKYKMTLNLKTLPKPGERTIKLGKIAEKEIPAYLELDRFTTHGVVAGATGGGKSITAQVIIEEALLKGIAVIVFDPTAQWSGMLRKCEDKKMMAVYPKFGLKPSDAKAFPGNVKMIKDARQMIDIKKYMNPGQIQILALNKLDPSDMDTFVASVIVSIFRSSPEEYPGLRVLLVFDEVHRLLPKFGGSGKGFLQIERACREFRKWGFGVMLVSQVLSDFVGEIKANINTEVQMRTRDEGDLNRIKTKYGEEFLQSLIKASVGVGMFVNPAYNKGAPYFINFRPILHSTRRLSDEILDKYNHYGDIIEDMEYQIEQLEAEKVDTFDLKMELKLVKDKLMTGNFTVVDIYLEGLIPRFEKQWETLGKKPKKLELQLVEQKDVDASIEAAEKERKKWEEKNKKPGEEKTEKKVDVSEKIVKSLTFDNGMAVSSLKELKDVLPGLDKEVFAIHVNKDKNQIADWVEKEIDPVLGGKLKGLTEKEKMVAALSEKLSAKKEGKKPEAGKGEKKPEAKKGEDKKESKQEAKKEDNPKEKNPAAKEDKKSKAPLEKGKAKK